MENQVFKMQNAVPAADVSQKKELLLPIAALLLDFAVPLVMFLLAYINLIFLLGIVLSPITGVIAGIAALCRGKKRIGKAGMVLSVLAVALPVLIVAVIVMLFTTGAVVLSM